MSSFSVFADTGFSTQSIISNLSISLVSPISGANQLSNVFTISLSDADENVTCVLWGNWSSWSSKTTGNNADLNNGTYLVNVSDGAGLVHNATYKWAVNCTSQTNSSDYKFSGNETFVYLNQTRLDQDSFEYDDDYTNAKEISIDGTEVEHSIYPADDVDYISFNASEGANYLIRTGNLKSGVNTSITLYDVDGITPLDQNDDVEPGVLSWSQIVWTAPANGTYYLKVIDWDISNTGNYTIFVKEFPNLELSFINFSKGYYLQQNSSFTVKLNVTCLGGDCSSIPIYLDPQEIDGSLDISKLAFQKADATVISEFYDLENDEYLNVIVLLNELDSDLSFNVDAGLGDFKTLNMVESFSQKRNSFEERKEFVENQQEDLFEELNIVPVKKDNKIKNKKLFRTLSDEVLDLDEGRSNILASNDASVIIGNRFTQLNGFSAKLTKEGFEKLLKNNLVQSIQLDEVFQVTNNDSIPLVNADDVWQEQVNGMNITGEGQTICIVDTGIAYNHSDFGGQNFFPNDKVIGGWDFINDDNDPFDDNSLGLAHGHGTHCAGTAAGESPIYTGVAPGAKLIAMKVMDASGSGTTSSIVAGLDWCIYHSQEYNISTISMSIGSFGPYETYCDSHPISKAINYANDQGIFVAVAAGNNGWSNGVSLPACASGAVTVSSIGKDYSTMSSFSNRGLLTDILAIGQNINSTYYLGGYQSMSGTSMATPQVAGAAALLNQYYKLTDGQFYHSEKIKHSLKESGPTIFDSGSGLNFTRLDILAALQEPVPKGIISTTIGATPFYTTDDNPRYVTLNDGESVELTWNVNATGDFSTYEFFAFASLEEMKSEIESETKNVSIIYPVAPEVILVTPLNDSSMNSSELFKFNISDAYGSQYSCDLFIDGNKTESGLFGLGQNNFSSSLPNNAHVWYVNCSDKFGTSNFSEERVVFSFDDVAPVVNLLNPEDNSYSNESSGPFTFSAYDESYDIENCSLFIDGIIVYTNTSVLENENITTVQILSEGSHYWNTLCFDSSPQKNNKTSENRTIIIDLTKPNTSISLTGTLNESGWYTGPISPSFSFLVNDTTSYKTHFNYNISWQNYTVPFSVLSQGNMTMRYYSIDEAGNNETVKELDFAIDTFVPVQEEYTTSPQAPVKDSEVILYVNATDSTSGIKNVTLTIDAGTVQEMTLENTTIYSYNFTPISVKTYDVIITTEDVAGNKNSVTYNLTVGNGEQGQYNFTENVSLSITNTTSDSEVSITVNTNLTGNVSVSQYETQPSFTVTEVTNAFHYVDFDASQNINDAMRWAKIELYYSTAEISGYTESTMKMYWYNETNETWTLVTTTLDFVNSTGLDQGSNYAWANVSHFSTYAIAADKRLCDDHYTNAAISSACFDETDTLRTSGYMCSHAYRSSACPEEITSSVGSGGGSGGMGGFSTTSSILTNETSSTEGSSEPAVEVTSTDKTSTKPVVATAKISGDDLSGAKTVDGDSKDSEKERPSFMPETLTTGHKLSFVALMLLIAGLFGFMIHYRDHTHRLSVEHKLNRYIEVVKDEHTNKTLDDWTKDMPEIDEKPRINLYEEQKNKIKDVDLGNLFSKK